MSGFRIFDVNSPADVRDWLGVWDAWPQREVFGHPEYLRLYATSGNRAYCAAWTSQDLIILHPFLVRDLADVPFWTGPPGALFDATSAYGYSGPYVWGEGDRDHAARKFWPEFHAWALDHQVVSEFVRLSLFPETRLPYAGATWLAGKQIIRALNPDRAVPWMDFEHKVRKNAAKAERCGVHVEIDRGGAHLTDFLDIYQHTMARRSALDTYYFPQEFFRQMCDRLPDQFAFFHAVHQNQTVSSELVLVSSSRVYSFLGGTLEDSFTCRPNDLLKVEIIRWAANHGKSGYVLGGGYRGQDGIYRYKRSFAPHGEVSQCLAGQVFSGDLYSALVGARERFAAERGEEWRPRQGYFPAYRS